MPDGPAVGYEGRATGPRPVGDGIEVKAAEGGAGSIVSCAVDAVLSEIRWCEFSTYLSSGVEFEREDLKGKWCGRGGETANFETEDNEKSQKQLPHPKRDDFLSRSQFPPMDRSTLPSFESLSRFDSDGLGCITLDLRPASPSLHIRDE